MLVSFHFLFTCLIAVKTILHATHPFEKGKSRGEREVYMSVFICNLEYNNTGHTLLTRTTTNL